MTACDWVLLLLAAVSTATWAWQLAAAGLLRRWVPRLGSPSDPAPARWPRVSVICPARDEADTLEAAIRSRLADPYPDVELLVVDDRSTDGTRAIADRIAAADPRVRALHVAALPDGWLGKVHALETGRRAATGEWLLFSDVDVHVEPGTLAAAVAHAEARGLDHLACLPAIWPTGFCVDAAVSALGRALAVGGRLWAVSDPRSSAFAGVGAWNMVRRSALDRTPGFEWLRLEVVDDVGLGRMVKLHGGRSAVALAADRIGLRFYPTLGAMARGIEKNGFAVAGRFRWWRLLLNGAVWLTLEWGVLVACAVGPAVVTRAVGAAGIALAILASAALARWTRRPLASAMLFPLGTALLLALMLRSAWIATRRGGVAWRDTVYPLDTLRAGQRIF